MPISVREHHQQNRVNILHSFGLETLDFVSGVKHFRQFLCGGKFVVMTDCNSLKASLSKIDLTSRVHRGWMFGKSLVLKLIVNQENG